jgi:hypothetical protein
MPILAMRPMAVTDRPQSGTRFARAGRVLLRILSVAALSLSPLIAAAKDRDPAVAQFREFQRELVEDKRRADWIAFLDEAKRLGAFLNGAPTSRLETARALLELGHRKAALRAVRRFLAMGQTHALLSSPLFEPLRPSVGGLIARNQSPISLATPAFQIADAGLLPEDIDHDSASNRFFVSSILEHRVVVLDEAGHPASFATSPHGWPMVALKVDSRRRRLWATEVAFDGFSDVASADWGHSVLLEYDLDDGALLAQFEGPARAELGDMILASNGDPVLSDGTGGGIYRLRGQALRRIDHGDFVSPQTTAICGNDRRAFVPDYVRGIAAFDLETGVARWLSMRDRHALNGIDGLYCHGASLTAVQNGASPERVISFSLNSTRSAVAAETIVERSTGSLGDPTHGVWVGTTFFYIANSGWDALDDHGAVKSASHLTPATVMRIDESRLTGSRNIN